MNSYLSVALAAALLHPSYTALLPDGLTNLTYEYIGAIPLTLVNYSSSVIPALLMVGALYYVDRFLDKVIPQLVKFFVKPVLDLLIVGFLTFFVLGPVGYLIGAALCNGLNTIDEHVGWLVPTLMGIFTPLLALTGMHNGLGPFMLQSFADRGYERLAGPGQLPSNVAQGAAALAVALRTKHNEEFKQMAFSAGITGVMGITEPAMFGVTIEVKKVLPCVMIGGGIGGFYAGIMGVKCYSFCAAGLLSLPAFISPDGWGNLINAVIAMCLGFFITFGLVYGAGCTGDETDEAKDLEKEAKPAVPAAEGVMALNIAAPVSGTAHAITECNDPVFASQALGNGVFIEPDEGKIFSPVDGEITVFSDTRHAIGIKADSGAEILIHVGMDTVTLNGEGFTSRIQEGQRVHKGQLLLEFDRDFIQSRGLSIATPVVVTNSADYENIDLKTGPCDVGDELILSF